MTVNAVNGSLLSAISAVDGVARSTLSAINGQTLAASNVPAVVGHSLLYTGNGGTNNITTAEIAPEIVIVRDRAGGAGTQWRLCDAVRGVGLTILPSTNAAESPEATGLTAFNSDGFSLGNSSAWNGNGKGMLALVLKRLASALDIVTYVGTGSAATVAHGLGVVPELIIVKNRTFSSRNWKVYVTALGNTKALTLDSTNGSDTSSAYWNNTSPTSSVFTVNNSTLVNASGNDYVAYLFASLNPGVKVGSYTGDGNTNGPAITAPGFRPRFVIIKRTDAVGGWYVFEDQADPTSPHSKYNVITGGATAEATTTNAAGGLDFTSTGFQSIDSAAADININGATYIYLAIA